METRTIRIQLIERLAPLVAIQKPDDLVAFTNDFLNDNDWVTARKYWAEIYYAPTTHGITVFTKDLRAASEQDGPQLAAANARIAVMAAALERIAEFNTFEEYGGFDEWLEAQAFTECQKIAKTALESAS